MDDKCHYIDAWDLLMGQKNGANYVVLYQMLCLMTINTNGRLSWQIGEVIIPYDVGKIQRDTKWFSTDTVRVALGLYAKLGLIYQEKDGTLVLANHSEMVGNETDYAAQKKLQRTNQRQIYAEHCGQCPQDVHTDVHKNVHTDIRDKILDIDKSSSSSKDDSSYIGTRTTKSLVDFFSGEYRQAEQDRRKRTNRLHRAHGRRSCVRCHGQVCGSGRRQLGVCPQGAGRSGKTWLQDRCGV